MDRWGYLFTSFFVLQLTSFTSITSAGLFLGNETLLSNLETEPIIIVWNVKNVVTLMFLSIPFK